MVGHVSQLAAVVLAAGQGTRMKSTVPKVLHAVAGRPMLSHVLTALEEMAAAPDPVVVVIGPDADEVRAAVGNSPTFAVQTTQLGTGHAALAALDACAGMAPAVLVLCGDVPLITGAVLDDLVKAHTDNPGAVATVLTARVANPAGYGRVERDPDGTVRRIVEEAEADSPLADDQEVNAGIGI
ncbi:MAG: NTP transferase domain-containing protein, partial [Anaerolineae bacterium]